MAALIRRLAIELQQLKATPLPSDATAAPVDEDQINGAWIRSGTATARANAQLTRSSPPHVNDIAGPWRITIFGGARARAARYRVMAPLDATH